MANLYEAYSNYLFARAGQSGVPLSGTFELTSRCNLDCRMCYIHRRANDRQAIRAERSTRDWLKLAEECCAEGTLLLLLTGGEPTIRPDFRELYTQLRRMGLMVSINSNATLIDEAMADFLAKDPPARINITLYGASPETYGDLCGDPSAYHRVIRAIRMLKERGVPVKLNYSVTQYNARDAEQVYTFAKENDLVLQAATYMFPPVRACEQGSFCADRMTPEEAAQAQLVYDRFRFPPEVLKARWEAQLRGLTVPDPDNECQELPTQRIRCRAGHTTFWVTWDGKLRPCGMMTEPEAVLKPGHFRQAWDELRKAREGIMVPAGCTACKYKNLCDQCPALCWAETGSFTESPIYMCKKTEAYLNLMKKNLKNML